MVSSWSDEATHFMFSTISEWEAVSQRHIAETVQKYFHNPQLAQRSGQDIELGKIYGEVMRSTKYAQRHVSDTQRLGGCLRE